MFKSNLKKASIVLFACFAVSATFTSCEEDENKDSDKTPPGIVLNFAASAGDALVNLTWEAPADDEIIPPVTGYELTPDNWVTKVSKSATEFSHTFKELTNGTEYTFKIRAVNAIGAGAESVQTATAVGSSETSDFDDYIKRLLDWIGVKTVAGITEVWYNTSSSIYDEVTVTVVYINQDNPSNCDVNVYVGIPESYWYNYYNGNTNVWSADQLAQMTWEEEYQCYWMFSENESTAIRLSLRRADSVIVE